MEKIWKRVIKKKSLDKNWKKFYNTVGGGEKNEEKKLMSKIHKSVFPWSKSDNCFFVLM
jgi:hypothetical protein